MAHEFTKERRVEFAETDMAGIVHFSNYFRYMEATEHAFFRSLDLTLHNRVEGRMQGLARVHAECDYRRPLHYQDLVAIRLIVREKDEHSLSYDFEFRVAPDERPVARGSMRVVCVSRDPAAERMQKCPIPAAVAELIQVAPSGS